MKVVAKQPTPKARLYHILFAASHHHMIKTGPTIYIVQYIHKYTRIIAYVLQAVSRYDVSHDGIYLQFAIRISSEAYMYVLGVSIVQPFNENNLDNVTVSNPPPPG